MPCEPFPTGVFLPEVSAPKKWLTAFYHFARLFLSGLFLYAALSKLTDIDAFAETIYAFGFLPEGLTHLTAFAILGTEIMAALLLMMDRRGGLLLIFLLTLMFLLVLGYGIHAGLDIDCGCFGVNDPAGNALSSLRTSFIRNIGLLGVMAFTQWARSHLNLQPKPFVCFQ